MQSIHIFHNLNDTLIFTYIEIPIEQRFDDEQHSQGFGAFKAQLFKHFQPNEIYYCDIC